MTALPGKPASNSVQSGHDQVLAVSPGERLQKARKERKLEVPEVAEHLNLSAGVVRALESDDYRVLPGPTFVKGYLRSYARLLEISSDDLVRAYEAITGCNQVVAVEPVAAPLISDGGTGLRKAALVVGVLLLVAIVLWRVLSGGDAAETTQASQPGQAPVVASESIREPVASTAEVVVNPPVVVTRVEPDEAETLAAAQALSEPVEAVVQAESAEVAQPSGVEPAAATQEAPVPVPEPLQSPVTAAEPAASIDPAPQSGRPTGLVNLRFSGECWVEVRDGSGALVFSSLKRAGEEVNLRETTPINVKLGNGDVVAVQFNHESVPFTTRPDRKVVRLTLGQ